MVTLVAAGLMLGQFWGGGEQAWLVNECSRYVIVVMSSVAQVTG